LLCFVRLVFNRSPTVTRGCLCAFSCAMRTAPHHLTTVDVPTGLSEALFFNRIRTTPAGELAFETCASSVRWASS
jgi:hypothetical protein